MRIKNLLVAPLLLLCVGACATVPDDPERVLDRLQRTGHLEHDADADALVLLCEPGWDIVHLAHVDDGVRAELEGEIEPIGDVVGREQSPRAERPRDCDREEPDRATPEHRDRTPGEILRRRREDGVAERLLQAGEVRR